jgi:hypothetical protein
MASLVTSRELEVRAIGDLLGVAFMRDVRNLRVLRATYGSAVFFR